MVSVTARRIRSSLCRPALRKTRTEFTRPRSSPRTVTPSRRRPFADCYGCVWRSSLLAGRSLQLHSSRTRRCLWAPASRSDWACTARLRRSAPTEPSGACSASIRRFGNREGGRAARILTVGSSTLRTRCHELQQNCSTSLAPACLERLVNLAQDIAADERAMRSGRRRSSRLDTRCPEQRPEVGAEGSGHLAPRLVRVVASPALAAHDHTGLRFPVPGGLGEQALEPVPMFLEKAGQVILGPPPASVAIDHRARGTFIERSRRGAGHRRMRGGRRPDVDSARRTTFGPRPVLNHHPDLSSSDALPGATAFAAKSIPGGNPAQSRVSNG
jgi:hypothetical protein